MDEEPDFIDKYIARRRAMNQEYGYWSTRLGECKVRTVATGRWPDQVVQAWPEESVPEVMTQASGWKGDHWEFSNDMSSHVLSVYDTWVYTTTGMQGQECPYRILELRMGGFYFAKWDQALLEQGAGI